MLDYIENDFASYRFTDGIVYMRYHIGISINLDAAIMIVEDRLRIHAGQCLLVICDIRGVKEINKPARDYLAKEGSVLIKAAAFIVEKPVSELLSRFYMLASKPPIPTEAFQSIEEAKFFLEKYI
ncbi:hypothetical protein [Aequorivita sp. KMM 9714]|uniref:DUF7793 family protein n=1 Tax=Aequorivita sp. KMM 9714 TaxID=2707173 RepID=UPI0013E9E3B0|nr:hypothetical protein [Aequorivita sp. KMM 9714]NGX82689.1 hypothetical protein [Aequorivita sp. KMM 9714]